MCDLFAMSCNDEDRATRSLPIFSEYANRNPDGWGIGWFEGNSAVVHRAACRADWDDAFFDSIDEARSRNLIAHIRYATQGEPNDCNCHPFTRHHNGRDWMLAHNGWVTGAGGHPMAEGETDSETIFHEIMDKVSEYQDSGTFRGKYTALKKAIENVFDLYDGTINLNLLISDGNMMYAFNHYSSKPMYMLRRSKAYGDAILISTKELTDENWEVIPRDRLLAINNGEIEMLSSPFFDEELDK
jgi:predicted glutamine amidotransferase